MFTNLGFNFSKTLAAAYTSSSIRQRQGVYNGHHYFRYALLCAAEQAGVPLEQAEVQAEVLTEAFTVNLESLVTKEFLQSRMDARFAEQKSYIDTRFAEQNAKTDSMFRFFMWTQAVILTAVILPYLERLLALQ